MTSEETKLKKLLLDNKATTAQGLQLYNLMTARGEAFPLELEELVLHLVLRDNPERKDLTSRLVHVLKSLGKEVPAQLQETLHQQAREEEWGRDHQKDAFEYHTRSGLKDLDPEFLPIYEKCRKFSMTSVERMYALYKAVNYVLDSGLPGAIVECGVWRGGSMMVVASTLLARGITDRELFLFDTFEGLPKPDTKVDIDLWGNRAIDGWVSLSAGDEKSGWANASIEDVSANLISTGYPEAKLHFVKGMVENTIPNSAPEHIALLRLDTDWYESTKHEMLHLYPRLANSGVLIIDDYGHFQGARMAIDEYMKAEGVKGLLCRIDYTGRLMIKTP